MGTFLEEKIEEEKRKKTLIFAEGGGMGPDPLEKTTGEWFKGLPYILPGGKDPDIESGYAKRAGGEFGPQAEWWKSQVSDDIDAEIVSFRGEDQLRAELKELYESGFFEGDEQMDAVIMGHADMNAMYGGVLPNKFGAILDEYQLDTKFDDVFLGSCGMGSDPVACMNVSAAFDGANVYAQGDPYAPEWQVNPNNPEDFAQNTWLSNPSWGTGSIDPSKISDPTASMAERIFTKNAPVQSYSFDPNNPEDMEKREWWINKEMELDRLNESLYNRLEYDYEVANRLNEAPNTYYGAR